MSSVFWRRQAARNLARRIVELGDRGLDPLSRFRGHARLVVDDPGHRHSRDAGPARHIPNRCSHGFRAHPEVLSGYKPNRRGGCQRRRHPASAGAAAAELVDGDGEQQHRAARRVLVEGRHVHEAHAVVEAAHQQRADQRAEDAAAAASERRAADDRGGDGVELEEEAGAAGDRAADPRRQRDAGDAVGEPGDEEVDEDDAARP